MSKAVLSEAHYVSVDCRGFGPFSTRGVLHVDMESSNFLMSKRGAFMLRDVEFVIGLPQTRKSQY